MGRIELVELVDSWEAEGFGRGLTLVSTWTLGCLQAAQPLHNHLLLLLGAVNAVNCFFVSPAHFSCTQERHWLQSMPSLTSYPSTFKANQISHHNIFNLSSGSTVELSVSLLLLLVRQILDKLVSVLLAYHTFYQSHKPPEVPKTAFVNQPLTYSSLLSLNCSNVKLALI